MSTVFESGFAVGQVVDEGVNDTFKSGQRLRQQPGNACEECRRKRIRCDRGTPQCVACANAGVKCVVRSTCAPRGPKKGHLRTLQKQIEELQNRFKEQREEQAAAADQHHGELPSEKAPNSDKDGEDVGSDCYPSMEFTPIGSAADIMGQFGDMPCWSPDEIGMENLLPNFMFSGFLVDSQQADGPAQGPSQILQEIGVHPNSMACADLDQLYFDRVHPFAPILQESRYSSWSKRPDKTKPQICLQYAMWTLAASLSTQFQLERRSLYNEARQLLVALEAENQANHINPNCVSIEQVQAWILLVIYELTNTDCNYQRGILSAGRAFRLVQMMRLYEVDGPGFEHSGQWHDQSDWVNIESMRRTFWLAYTVDRFTSAIDGLPLAFNERQILTRLPAPEVNFLSGRPATMCFLSDVMNGLDEDRTPDNVWPFTKSIVIATICGRALEHKYFLPHADRNQDVTYDYRHHFQSSQSLNALLTQHIKLLSKHVSLASERPDPVLIFVALIAHMVVFVLSETMESTPQFSESQAQSQGQGQGQQQQQQQQQQQGAQEADALVLEHKRRSLELVHKLNALTATLAQLNHFRTHPLTPIPLLLSARFCLARTGLDDTYGTFLPLVTSALQRLKKSNGLAQMCLQRLGLEREVAGLLQ
ncbi:Transcription factor [Colletotrichum tabaci]|uniref:Transcription factor n=1 Tax=Colletotrichum tabaci TaxID=1209068 RepID=A0AAV9TDL3_9PEZI